MLYFSSYHTPQQTISTLEELFKYIEPENVLLIFDTNIVIYCRDFFLAPRQFILSQQQSDAYLSVRYLIEQIQRYDLQVNAMLGVSESSRSKQDYTINVAKQQQTLNAIESILQIDSRLLDTFIQNKIPEKFIVDNDECLETMIPCLKNEELAFRDLLIVSYLLSLKLIRLYYDLQNKAIAPIDAYINFYSFMKNEINIYAGIFLLFALHIYGGDESFKPIIFPRNSDKINNKLHKIFNGAIDITYPTRAIGISHAQEIMDKKKYIPVFVSADKRLSVLHSLGRNYMSIKSTMAFTNIKTFHHYIWNDNLKWTNSELNSIYKMSMPDIKRILSPPQRINISYSLVEKCEDDLKSYWGNNL